MPSVRKVNAAWAGQIAQLLEARGRRSKLILKEVGLDPKRVEKPDARIPFAKHVALLEAAATQLNDPCFGLHFGSSVDPLDAGLIGYVGASSATLGATFRNLVAFLRVFTEGVQARLEIEDQLAALTFEVIDPDTRKRQQIQEFGAALLVNFSRFVTSRRLTPEWVEFSHNRQGNREEFEKYFGSAVHFGRPRTAVVLNRRHLDLPCKTADVRLLGVLKGYCQDIFAQRSQETDLKGDVEQLIATLLPSGTATCQRVAGELGMSERTMARRLAELGTSFGQILGRVRRELAYRYLEGPHARTSQVAYLLGYSEPSAFNHAFRRWTGVSPSDFAKSIK